LTNSSFESEIESNNVSIILDTPSFDAKVKKKHKFSPALSSSIATLSPISFVGGHDTDALLSFSLNSDNKDNIDSCSWDSDKAMACFHCSELSFRKCCEFARMPKVKSTTKKEKRGRKTERRVLLNRGPRFGVRRSLGSWPMAESSRAPRVRILLRVREISATISVKCTTCGVIH